MKKYVFLVHSLALIVLIGCNNQILPEDRSDKTYYSKEIIQEILDADNELYNIKWSPDNKKVLYIDKSNMNTDNPNIYLWTVGEEKGEFVRTISPINEGFKWSPNSEYFAVCDSFVDIVKADNLSHPFPGTLFVSNSLPVWSPDSKQFLTSGIETDKKTKWSTIRMHTLGEENSVVISKSDNSSIIYKVKYWNIKNQIGYIKINNDTQTEQEIILILGM